MSQNEEEINTPEKAQEQLQKEQEEKQKAIRTAEDRRELATIKHRIIQQFHSPYSPYRGIVTSKEEENMIEDQAKAMLRERRKQQGNSS